MLNQCFIKLFLHFHVMLMFFLLTRKQKMNNENHVRKKKKMYGRFRNTNLSYFWWCLCLASNGVDILMFVWTNGWFDSHRLCFLFQLFGSGWPIFRIQKIKWIIDFMGIFTNITYNKFVVVNIDWTHIKLIENILVY